MHVKLTLPSSLAPRVERAATLRGLDVPTFILTMLAWHAPGVDNEVQYLKDRVRRAVETAASPTEVVEGVLRVVGS